MRYVHGFTGEAVASLLAMCDSGRIRAWTMVPQVGLEPTTHGFAVVILLSALLIVRAFAHLPALPGAPALPIGPARLALSRLPAIRTGFPAFHSGGSVDYEHSTPCSGTARASRLGGAH